MFGLIGGGVMVDVGDVVSNVSVIVIRKIWCIFRIFYLLRFIVIY